MSSDKPKQCLLYLSNVKQEGEDVLIPSSDFAQLESLKIRGGAAHNPLCLDVLVMDSLPCNPEGRMVPKNPQYSILLTKSILAQTSQAKIN